MTPEKIVAREAALRPHEDEMLRIYTKELNDAVNGLESAAGIRARGEIIADAQYYASQISKLLSLIDS